MLGSLGESTGHWGDTPTEYGMALHSAKLALFAAYSAKIEVGII